jgi:hypothetical protein
VPLNGCLKGMAVATLKIGRNSVGMLCCKYLMKEGKKERTISLCHFLVLGVYHSIMCYRKGTR